MSSPTAHSTSYLPGKWYRGYNPDSAGPVLLPVWVEQHAPGAAVDSLRDSVSYDGWERVTAVVMLRNNAVVQRDTFRFNRTGDILTTAGGEVYDATTGRLLSRAGGACGTWSYAYDRAGNLVSAVCGSTTWSYGYDALNQLRAVLYNGTLIARYAHDVLGRRIAKRVYSSATGGTMGYTRFIYHGSHVAFETDSVGTIGLRYTWGSATDDLLAIRDASGNHYYVTQDPLRSVRGLVKRSDGSWVRSLRYGPYGAVVKDTAAAGAPTWELRYRWTGQEYDAETGFYYHRTRYYDQAVRRFVQEDKIGYAGGANVYAYGEGSPLAGRDPDGLVMDYERFYSSDPNEACILYREACGWGPRGQSGFWSWLDAHTAYVDAVWAAIDAYHEYLRGYEQTKQSLVEYFAREGNKALTLALHEHSHALSFTQFTRAGEAIGILLVRVPLRLHAP